MYTPKPINTDSITLNDDMLALSEQLAENVHDIWALGRMSEGWTYGEQRDDELKQSPCLIPIPISLNPKRNMTATPLWPL